MKIDFRFLFIFCTLIHHSAATCGTREGEYVWDGSTSLSLPTNYTEFQLNLDNVLDHLPSNKTKISLYSWVGVYTGLDPNAAYAQARCIGNVDYTTCANCIQQATTVLKNDCYGKQTSAILWYGDSCMVRYSDHNMIGTIQMPDKMIRIKTSPGNSSSTTAFDGARTNLFNVLSSRAEDRPGGYRMISAGKWYDYLSNETIYGVAQCSPDLYSYQCSSCLAIVGQNLEKYFNGKLGGSIVGPSCNFQYEVYPFVANTLLFVDYSQPIPSPPPPPRNVLPRAVTGEGSKKAVHVSYIVAPLVLISMIL